MQLLRRPSPTTRPAPKNNGTNDNGRSLAPMTDSQRRAILAIAKRWEINLEHVCRNQFGCVLDQLSLRQASELIDHLKASQPAGNGRR
jgi:hypothetical protein